MYCNVSNFMLEITNHQKLGFGIKLISNNHCFELFG